MKYLKELLSCLLITIAMSGNAMAADEQRDNFTTGTVDHVAPETRTIIIDDWVYQYRPSVTIHARHTNYGTIDLMKPGTSVRFRAQPGDVPVIEEIWIGEQRAQQRGTRDHQPKRNMIGR